MPDNAAVETVLRQLSVVLGDVREDDLGRPTPCQDWTVSDLLDHLVVTTDNFIRLAEGGEADWAAAPPEVDDRRAAAQQRAEELLRAVSGPSRSADLSFAVPE